MTTNGSDLLHQQLIAGDSTVTRAFRAKHGSTEVMFVAAHGLSLVTSVLETALLLHSGIAALAKQPSLCALVEKTLGPEDHQSRAELDRCREDSLRQARQLRKVLDDDFGPVNAITAVNLCAAIEAATEDTLLATIRFVPETINRLRAVGVRKIDVYSERDLSYEGSRRVYRKFAAWARVDEQAPDGTLKMLRVVGMDVKLSDDVRADLHELIQVRNLIVHAGQRADPTSNTHTRHVQFESGKLFKLPRSAMGHYSNAAMELTSRLAKIATEDLFRKSGLSEGGAK